MIADRSANWKWWVCGVLLLATFLNYMDRQALANTLPELKREFNLGERRIGLVEGCFGFAFAGGSLFFGVLADKFGPRRLYPIVLAGWSLAGIATGFAGHAEVTSLLESPDDEPGAGTFRWLLIWRTVLGLFEAGHWPCALITAQRLLSAKDRTLGNGILQSGASVASILIPIYVEVCSSIGLGWRFVFWSIGVVGLLWIPLWLGLVSRDDLDRSAASVATDTPTDAQADVAGFVRRLIVLVVVVSCLAVSWQFLRAWLPLLFDFHGYSSWDLRLATAGYFVAAEVGCLLVGFVVMRLVRNGLPVHAARVWTFAGFTALAGMAAVVPFVGSGWEMIAGLMLAGAGILGLHPLYYSLSQEMSQRRMGLFSGGLGFVAWMISSAFQILIGARIQETKSYDVGLVIAGAAPLVGLIVLVTVWKSAAATERG